jgi:hypothetical protein
VRAFSAQKCGPRKTEARKWSAAGRAVSCTASATLLVSLSGFLNKGESNADFARSQPQPAAPA